MYQGEAYWDRHWVRFQDHSWIISGPFRDHVGTISGPFWSPNGLKMEPFGVQMEHTWPTCSLFGPNGGPWALNGVPLVAFGVSRGSPGEPFGRPGRPQGVPLVRFFDIWGTKNETKRC